MAPWGGGGFVELTTTKLSVTDSSQYWDPMVKSLVHGGVLWRSQATGLRQEHCFCRTRPS